MALQDARVAAAADCPAPCRTGLSAAQVFALAEAQRAAGRTDAAERLLLALTADPDADHRAEARFRLGQLYEPTARPRDAIAIWRRLLDEKPQAARVRLDLARLLARAGDEAAARRELRIVGAGPLPEDVAQVVDRFATALRSRRPLGISVEVAIAPDSNVNAATRQRTIETVIADLTLDADARARAGIGVSLAAQGFARVPLGGVETLTRLSLGGDRYRASRFNTGFATLAGGPEFQYRGWRIRPAATLARRWFGGARLADAAGVSLNLLRALGRATQIELEASATRLDYRIAAQDGTSWDVNAVLDRAVDARWSVRGTLRASRLAARDPGYSLGTIAVGALAARQGPVLAAFVQADVAHSAADARLLLFPQVRNDWRWSATGGLVWRRHRILGAAPLVRVSATRNQSTVPLYAFRRIRAEFALSREF